MKTIKIKNILYTVNNILTIFHMFSLLKFGLKCCTDVVQYYCNVTLFYSVTRKAHCKRNKKTLALSPDEKII